MLKTKMLGVLLALAGGLLVLCPDSPSDAACSSVTSATMTLGMDDTMSVWVNGHPEGAVGMTEGKSNLPLTITIPTGDINPSTTNTIAVYVHNTTAGYAWGSWDLQVTCPEGTFDLSSAGTSCIQMYSWVKTGSAGYPANANSVTPFANTGGIEWFNPSYVQGSG